VYVDKQPEPLNLGVPVVYFPGVNAFLARAQALLWLRDCKRRENLQFGVLENARTTSITHAGDLTIHFFSIRDQEYHCMNTIYGRLCLDN
jgi:hypothetical protein